ncbi:Alpha-D-GlcNAc alpha-1,2-L-rhamnosyltransferase [Streptococcus pyogenes]|nr:Alpha-D-GlcNAc alpha-1,2-L-rhamnosyltransferase [Streptococcus pyogenes]
MAKSAALYWTKQKGQLAELINQVDAGFDSDRLGKEAKAIIQEHYTWEKIVGEYEALFLNEH